MTKCLTCQIFDIYTVFVQKCFGLILSTNTARTATTLNVTAFESIGAQCLLLTTTTLTKPICASSVVGMRIRNYSQLSRNMTGQIIDALSMFIQQAIVYVGVPYGTKTTTTSCGTSQQVVASDKFFRSTRTTTQPKRTTSHRVRISNYCNLSELLISQILTAWHMSYCTIYTCVGLILRLTIGGKIGVH